jgi:cytochrome c553
LSARGGRRRGATAAAEAGIALAMLFLMFVSALVGFGVGRHTGDGGNDNVAAVSTTQTAEETVTTSGGAGGEGTTTEETATSTESETTAPETTTAAGGGGGGGGNALATGKNVFASAGCGGCHTLKAAGSSGNVGPNLDEAKPSFDKAVERVTNGKPPMPAFKGQLSDAQIKAVAKFVSSSTRG